MHISEGVLSAPVLLGGAVLTLGGLTQGLRRITAEDVPKAAILAAVFFTASLIHVKVGPAATHLVLSGLIGLLMGWAAFPVVFIGLLLQGLLFQFGGLTTLGINTFNIAAPAALLGVLTRPGLVSGRKAASACALLCGGGSILLSSLLAAFSLRLGGQEFTVAAYALAAVNLPIAAAEAVITLFCLQFILKVRPRLLTGHVLAGPEKRDA